MHELPSNITVIEQRNGAVFVLPPSMSVDTAAVFGCLPMLLGMPFVFIITQFMTGDAMALMRLVNALMHGQNADWNTWGVVVFSMIFLLPLLVVIVVGWWWALGGVAVLEVEVRGKTLRVVKRVGILRWVRHRPLAGIERLNVTGGHPRNSQPYPPSGREPPDKLSSINGDILAEGRNIKPIKIASGYPWPMIRAFAAVLAERIERVQKKAIDGAYVEVVERRSLLPNTKTRLKVNPSIDKFFIFWWAVMFMVTSFAIFRALTNPFASLKDWACMLWTIPFWGIGLGLWWVCTRPRSRL